MSNNMIDVKRLDYIIKNTVESINNGKKEIYDIAENAKKECKKLEEELKNLKKQVNELVQHVEHLEVELKESKRKLMLVNKNFDRFDQEELKSIYQKADNLRIELAVKREQEHQMIRRRNDLEIRIKDSFRTVEKAENLIATVGVALGYLTGDLMNLTSTLESMQQRQLMGTRIIKAQEEERQRVAREIHDGPAQSMSNVVLKAEICEKLVDVDLDKAKQELQNLKGIVRDSLQEVRKIIYNLRPMSLDDLGLVPTLERYILTFNEEHGMQVKFRALGSYNDIIPIVSLTLFRIVQEALSNIYKHAQAQNAAINLEFFDSEVILLIIDDGVGFDFEETKKRGFDINGGFGLFSIQERVELLSGEFELTSKPVKGTKIRIKIPLVQE